MRKEGRGGARTRREDGEEGGPRTRKEGQGGTTNRKERERGRRHGKERGGRRKALLAHLLLLGSEYEGGDELKIGKGVFLMGL